MEKFNNKIAKYIALRSFGHVLDCILGYSNEGYDIGTKVDEFIQNFQEDLEEKRMVVTDIRINKISEYYKKLQSEFEKNTRKKYYKSKSPC